LGGITQRRLTPTESLLPLVWGFLFLSGAERRMFTHKQIWAAIDAIAQAQGISVSALAKCAGLDATTFNRSKRFNPDGRERWPSTQSLARVLKVANLDLRALADIIGSLPDEEAGNAQSPGPKPKGQRTRRG
jgi:phage repressor protein C with HTH and peptisase S24 domain